jgi:XTP/dITP diphosphohydrolase
MELVIATRNEKKEKEIKNLLKCSGLSIISLKDYPQLSGIKEEGKTFRDNAVQKAKSVAVFTNKWTLADDSGLEVDALDGRPGIYSARFAGAQQNDQANIRKLLQLMKKVPQDKRQARFKCFVAISKPGGEIAKVVNGVCEGLISFEPRGKSGFGYDPVFIVPAYDKTFAELGPAIKDQISHRSKALKQAREFIKTLVSAN